MPTNNGTQEHRASLTALSVEARDARAVARANANQGERTRGAGTQDSSRQQEVEDDVEEVEIDSATSIGAGSSNERSTAASTNEASGLPPQLMEAMKRQMEAFMQEFARSTAAPMQADQEEQRKKKLREEQARKLVATTSDALEPEEVGEIATTNDIHQIWKERNEERMNKALKLLNRYNNRAEDKAVRDYMAWFSSVFDRLNTYDNYHATYLLTVLTGADYTKVSLEKYKERTPLKQFRRLAHAYGRTVYSRAKQNPIFIAKHLKINWDNIDCHKALYQRVVDLHHCVARKSKAIVICYEIFLAIGYHVPAALHEGYLQEVRGKYLALKTVAEFANEAKRELTAAEIGAIVKQDLPVIKEDIWPFCEWLMQIAEYETMTRDLWDRDWDKEKVKDKVDRRAYERNATLKNRYHGWERGSIYSAQTSSQTSRNSVASNTTSERATKAATIGEGNRGKKQYYLRDGRKVCKEHPYSNHTDEECHKQRPKLPPEQRCTVHPDLNHSNDECYVQHPERRRQERTNYNNANQSITEERATYRRGENQRWRGGRRFTGNRYNRRYHENAFYQGENPSRQHNQPRTNERQKTEEKEGQDREGVSDGIAQPNRNDLICNRGVEEDQKMMEEQQKDEDSDVEMGCSDNDEYMESAESPEECKNDSSMQWIVMENQILADLLVEEQGVDLPEQIEVYTNRCKEIFRQRHCAKAQLMQQVETEVQSRLNDIYGQRLEGVITIPFYPHRRLNPKGKRPICKMLINHIPQLMLIDTGSDVCMMDRNYARNISPSRICRLSRPIVCRPFNHFENATAHHSRMTIINKMAMIPIHLIDTTIEFPFYLFPGILEPNIIGMDLLTQVKGYVLGHLSCICIEATKEDFEELVTKVTSGRRNYNEDKPWKSVPGHSAKGCLIEGQQLYSNQLAKVQVMFPKRKLNPDSIYQVGILPKGTNTDTLLVREHLLVTNNKNSLETVDMHLLSINNRYLKAGESMCWLAELPRKLVDFSMVQQVNIEEDYPTESKFTPTPRFDDFPLPSDESCDNDLEDYTQEEYEQAAKEVEKYVIKKGEQVFIRIKEGVEIPAGKGYPSDAHLVLTAKAIAEAADKVWDAEYDNELPGVKMSDVVITVPLKIDKPIYSKPRRINPTIKKSVEEDLQRQIRLGLIEKSNSQYASPILVVPKANGKIRIVIDYRMLNAVAVADRYPLPIMREIINKAIGCKYLSLIDLPSGFNQFFIHPNDREKLAFITPEGLYQPTRLPFGYLNGPAVFQRQYDLTLGPMTQWSRPYIDDLLICDNNHKRHNREFATILFNLFRRRLIANNTKSSILGTSVTLLGNEVTGEGVKPYIKDYTFEKLKLRRHKTLTDLQMTQGTLNWFSRWIKGFAFIMRPIREVISLVTTSQNTTADLDAICRPVIEQVEEQLKQRQMQAHLLPTAEKTVHIQIGALAFAVAIYQRNNKKKELLEYWSKVWTLKVDEYTEEEKYALAVRDTLKKFHHMLISAEKIVISTPSTNFRTIANDRARWIGKVAMFLPLTCSLPIHFQQKQCKELLSLSDQETKFKLEALIDIEADRAAFFNLPAEQVAKIPQVWVDGSAAKPVGCERVGGVGVFWGEDSRDNLGLQAQLGPEFSNQRSELEAMYVAIKQAYNKGLTKLILYSDSEYAVGLAKKYAVHPVTKMNFKRGRKGTLKNIPKNNDIVTKIAELTLQVKTNFNAIKRPFNAQADLLSRKYLEQLKSQKQLKDGGLVQHVSTMTFDEMFEDEEGLYTEEDEVQIMSSDEVKFLFASYYQEPEEVMTLEEYYEEANREKEEIATAIRLIESQPTTTTLLDRTHYLDLIEQMPTFQRQDPDINKLIEAYASREDEGLPLSVKQYFPHVIIVPQSQMVMVRNNNIEKILVPKHKQQHVIEVMHQASNLGGHCSTLPTRDRIERLFIWKTLRMDVSQYCIHCRICAKTKADIGKPKGLLNPLPIPSKTFYYLHADCITGLPKSRPPGSCTDALVVIDAFTKFMFAYPMSDIRAESMEKRFNSLFHVFGAPLRVTTDRGTEFNNKTMRRLFRIWGVNHRMATARNPQSNGQAEAAVKIITARLRTILEHYFVTGESKRYNPGRWVDALPHVIYSYNTNPQKKLGCSPYEMMFGRLPPEPLDEKEREQRLWKDVTDDYLNNLKDVLSLYHDNATERLGRHQQTMKRYYDKNRLPFTANVGDYVYLKPPYSDMSNKLAPTVIGPLKIIKVQINPFSKMITGIVLNLGTDERPVKRWFPRERVRLAKHGNPQLDWDDASDLSAIVNNVFILYGNDYQEMDC